MAIAFTDGMGRPLSMATVRHLIDLVHSRHIAAMPYTAIYGASMAFYQQHPDWALVDANGDLLTLGSFIAILDPTPGSPWNRHLLAEFADVLDHTAFDGIHIDQYGSPKVAFDAAGNRVDLAEVFPQFIDQTAALVQQKRGERRRGDLQRRRQLARRSGRARRSRTSSISRSGPPTTITPT